MSGILARMAGYLRSHVPTRDGLADNRWLRPFAHLVLRPDLWRFTRRSVPRGVALVLFTGILIPFAHSFIAALTSVFVRANVPVAIATTWISNPITWLVIFPTAAWIGNALGLPVDMHHFRHMVHHGASLHEWGHWAFSKAAGPIMLGLLIEAVVVSGLGYMLTSIAWRWRIRFYRRARLARSAMRTGLAQAV